MARTPKTTSDAGGKPAGRAVANRKPDATAIVDYEAQMLADAEKLADSEKGGGLGKSFSFKGGILSFDGAPIKGNQMAVIITGSMIEKAFYTGRYDPNNPEPPVCFALSTEPDDLAPIPEDVADLQNDVCETCEHNQWGSADTGRGKACKDVRRLQMIPAGTIEKNGDVNLIDDVKAIEKAEAGNAKLPPTSLNAWAAYVRTLASTLKRPPHGVFTMVSVEPDDQNQFRIVFEPLEIIDKKLLAAVYARHKTAMEELKRPYTYPTDEQRASRQAQNGRGRGTARGGAAKPAGRGKPAAAKGGATGGRSSRKY